MSPIGRLFIVLNLVLAGAFVGFAGTYLQKASTWKEQHDALQVSSDTVIATLQGQLEVKQKDLNGLNTRFAAADTKANTQQTRNEDLARENERLAAQLADIQGDIKTLVGNNSSIATNVERATTEASSARQQSIEASSARDAALREKDVAVADLADVQAAVGSLERAVESKDQRITELEDELRQQKMLLDIATGKSVSASGEPIMAATAKAGGK